MAYKSSMKRDHVALNLSSFEFLLSFSELLMSIGRMDLYLCDRFMLSRYHALSWPQLFPNHSLLAWYMTMPTKVSMIQAPKKLVVMVILYKVLWSSVFSKYNQNIVAEKRMRFKNMRLSSNPSIETPNWSATSKIAQTAIIRKKLKAGPKSILKATLTKRKIRAKSKNPVQKWNLSL